MLPISNTNLPMVFTIFGSSFLTKLFIVLIAMGSTTGFYSVILYSVSLIVAIRSPPQVFNPVIHLITIDVVNL